LFAEIKVRCEQLRDNGNISNQFAPDNSAIDERQCHLRNNRVSLIVTMRMSDFAPDMLPELAVREFDNRLAFPGERLFYPDGEPREISTKMFHPELSRAHEQGWTPVGESSFLASQELAEKIVIQFVDLIEKADRGNFQRSLTHSRAHRRAF
jgi:hypothetical protein